MARWSIIAAQLPGRTDNDVKNYWNTKLKKRLLGRRKDRQSAAATAATSETSAENMNDAGERALSASAMERIQLCMQLQELQSPLGAAHHNPLVWPGTGCSRAATLSNNSFNSNSSTVTVAEQAGRSSSMNEHLMSAQQLDGGLGSPSSAENSNVISMEAELEELLYGEGNGSGKAAGAVDGGVQQGGVDWWSYDDQVKSPVGCWDFAPETTNAVFQDYTSVYDI